MKSLMDRLSLRVLQPLFTFHQCQLCGFASDDICEFHLWQECDEQDHLEPGNVLMVCRKGSCRKIINDHPRLYQQVEWGAGDPGHFIFTCEACSFRENGNCKHPDLKANGGSGLTVHFDSPFGRSTTVCTTDAQGDNHCQQIPMQAKSCDGFKPRATWD